MANRKQERRTNPNRLTETQFRRDGNKALKVLRTMLTEPRLVHIDWRGRSLAYRYGALLALQKNASLRAAHAAGLKHEQDIASRMKRAR